MAEECRLRNLVCCFVQNFYSIPVGTSGHLKDLLVGLLKRNPRDRMDFGRKSIHSCFCFKPILSDPYLILNTRLSVAILRDPGAASQDNAIFSGAAGALLPLK